MSLVMLAWLSLQDNHMVHSILVVTTHTQERLCCKVCHVSYNTVSTQYTHMIRTTHLGCYKPLACQAASRLNEVMASLYAGPNLPRQSQGSQTIIMLDFYN